MNVTKSEFIILSILWDEHPQSVGEIIEKARQDNDWHDNTIKTLLSRLCEKQAVERFKSGRRYSFRPTISRDEVLEEESEGFLSQFFSGKVAPFVAQFAKNKKLSAKDIEDIQKILDGMKK